MSDLFFEAINEAAKKFAEAREEESNAAIKIVKNGPTDKPFCMVQDGKTLMCHKTMKEAQDHMNKMMDEEAARKKRMKMKKINRSY